MTKEFMVLLCTEKLTDLVLIREDALRTFGGYTQGPAQIGAWTSPESGEVHYDGSFPLYLTFGVDRSFAFVAFVDRVKKLLNQESMYVRCPNGEVKFW
jgi:hypothetical protein